MRHNLSLSEAQTMQENVRDYNSISKLQRLYCQQTQANISLEFINSRLTPMHLVSALGLALSVCSVFVLYLYMHPIEGEQLNHSRLFYSILYMKSNDSIKTHGM